MVNSHLCSNFFIKESLAIAKESIIIFMNDLDKQREYEMKNCKLNKEDIEKINYIYDKYFKDPILEQVVKSIENQSSKLILKEDIGINCVVPDVRKLNVKFLNTNIVLINYVRTQIKKDLEVFINEKRINIGIIFECYDCLIRHIERIISTIKSNYPDYFRDNPV